MSYPILDDIKEYLGIEREDDDYLLTVLLERAIKVFESITDRVFVCEEDTTKVFEVFDRGVVSNRKFILYDDLCSITSLEINGTVLDPSKYKAIDSAPYTSINLYASSPLYFINYSSTSDPTEFEITGKWAYSETCPNDVYGAIVRLTAWLYHQKDNAADYDRPVAFSNTLQLSVGLPSDIVEISKIYKRLF